MNQCKLRPGALSAAGRLFQMWGPAAEELVTKTGIRPWDNTCSGMRRVQMSST